MNNELFDKRILFESLSCIMQNQNTIMSNLEIKPNNSNKYNDYLYEQCDAIASRIMWEESAEH